MNTTPTTSPRSWIRPEDARLPDLLAVLTEQTDLADYPHATRVEREVLVYDWAACGLRRRTTPAGTTSRPSWHARCVTGPGSSC